MPARDAIDILMIEDVATDAELAVHQLRRDGMDVRMRRVETREQFAAALQAATPDVIVSDYSLPHFDGLSALALARTMAPDVPFLFLSGTIGEETAIEALKQGAVDYVLKTNLARLSPAVRRALDDARAERERRFAERRFADLIEFAPHALVVLNHDGGIEIVNAQLEALFGYPRDQLLGRRCDVLIPGRFDEWLLCLRDGEHPDKHQATQPLTFEVTARRRGGEFFPAEVSLSPLNTTGGMWISGVIRDITERKLQEARIARLSRIHTVLSRIGNAIARVRDRDRFLHEACHIAVEAGQFAAAWIGIVDEQAGMLRPVAWSGLSPDFMATFQISIDPDKPSGRGPGGRALRTGEWQVVHDVEYDESLSAMRETLMRQGFQSICALPLMLEDGPVGILALYHQQKGVFDDEEMRLLGMVASDISFALDRFGKEEQLNYLAHFDTLTGLPNRSLFQDRLEQLLHAGDDALRQRAAVVFLDIDRFRNYNDTFGRSATDDLLREVASRLRGVLPDPAFLARIHGDCFGFVLKDVQSEAEVVARLEREVAACLAEPHAAFGKDVRIAATAGIAMYPADGRDGDTLLRNAEAALKHAKTARMPHRFYTAAMNARAAEKLSIENRLRRALEEEHFVLHYQPKVDLSSGQIAGLEALIRWQEPGGELVGPDRFIHILEETGLIVDVGYWVIRQAHRQASEWAAQGIAPPRIAVNVSQMQIRQNDFVGHVLHMLGNEEVRDLELEITESLFMEGSDQEGARMKLSRLRANGITMAIDDFGTGYSSLSYIAHLPIDTLKIDRSFVSDMTTSPDHMAIVSTIISLAHALDLKVVAEGVETEEQYDLLKSLDCDQVQGFYYGRTVPADEIATRLMQQQAA